MNVLKPFDVGFTSNEDAIRDLEDYNPLDDLPVLDDIVTGKGFEVVRNDYDVVNAVAPSYGFEKMVEESRVILSEKRVSILNLNIMALECLSGEIGRLDGLEYLYLTNNCLSVLPSEIGNLINLNSLGLGVNSLSVLPVEFGNLVELESLSLSYNNLIDLPQELCDWLNLCYLNVKNNPISDYCVVNKLIEKGVEVHR